VDEGFLHLVVSEAGEVVAGLVQANAAQPHVADGEFAVDEVVEGDATGDDVATQGEGTQAEAEGPTGRNRRDLDTRRARPIARGALTLAARTAQSPALGKGGPGWVRPFPFLPSSPDAGEFHNVPRPQQRAKLNSEQ